MKQADESLRRRLRDAWQAREAGRARGFDAVWRHAEARSARARRGYRRVAVGAAVVGIIAVVVGVRPSTERPGYIEMAELLGSTCWSAPSDVLLPEREFDIYQELPVLFESI